MKEFLNKNLVSLIVLALLIIVYLQRCSGEGDGTKSGVNTHDTIIIEHHHYHDSTIISKPTIINRIAAKVEDIPLKMLPNTDSAILRAQYDSLLQLYYSKNISTDSIKIDSIGTVKLIDTLSQNNIVSRKWNYKFDIKERLTTITNTIYPKSKIQLYAGIGILGNEEDIVNGVEIGFLLKNKKDQMFGISAQKMIDWPVEYGIQTYWKVNLKKR